MTPLYIYTLEDAESQVGRSLTKDEVNDLTKALENALGDEVSDIVYQVCGGED